MKQITLPIGLNNLVAEMTNLQEVYPWIYTSKVFKAPSSSLYRLD
jgi:hypothetical protein